MQETDGHRNGNGTGGYASRAQLAELDRQIERGSLFTQATLQRGFRRLGTAEALLVGLLEALTAKGVLTEEEVDRILSDDDGSGPIGRVTEPVVGAEGAEGAGGADGAQAEDEADEADEEPTTPTIKWPSIAMRVDDPDQGDEPETPVDCGARMHVCHAVCCQLKFPLSSDEVESGLVKWDIGHPYIIRHQSTGWCTHNDTATHRCDIYADRPGTCRRYSCAGDTRIWKDFDGMVLNQEWIDDHLGRRDLSLTDVLPAMEEHVKPTGA